ncbi:RNA polymerase subunit sigma-70 [Thermogemmatispora carboxidivorans]|uniref:RNA polymerase subunit sigma-70 n=1 Tax=Thermogemmatispora carboxidivorans TaxID=1382306 RepID=UPI00069BC851|nr:RNA polymerase subunit sigma-70 [Thermogemmatispora carboxidivorans]
MNASEKQQAQAHGTDTIRSLDPGSPEADSNVTRQPDIGLLLESHRQELLTYCYRLMGSLHDAEDQVQETMLRAWRHYHTLNGSASLRPWLYKIATNTCLDALKKRSSRTLPLAAFPPADPESPLPAPLTEARWLEPLPHHWLAAEAENPEARYTRAESISLAFLTALQWLPPRQRAVLILADVLDWRAREIAHLLGSSIGAVNSILHRARLTLEQRYRAQEPETARQQPADEEMRRLLARYMYAWEHDDIEGLIALLKEEATLSMPPYAAWYQGVAAIRTILAACPFQSGKPQQWRLLPTVANGQPAFAVYRLNAARDAYTAYGIQVVCLERTAAAVARVITSVIMFLNATLVVSFGLPEQLPLTADQPSHSHPVPALPQASHSPEQGSDNR